ncbi:hypothetical protein B4146_1926 [Bacillus subtilis]|uniref:Uncharacterized protein n=1 Tax=Bacillus subtilis TaxID=1423 RepID=A0AAP1E985_BACIU|nr:hypothetical protein B4146_1926 [Bacillus subtilis]KZD95116.1 hypothetical protein B4122_0088 [Bacillus subtilis]
MQNGQVDFFKSMMKCSSCFFIEKKDEHKNRYTGKIILLERGELTDG